MAQLHILIQIREPVITEKPIYIPYACKGMVQELQHVHGDFLKLLLDAKQKVLSNRWSVLTFGFITRRQDVSNTTIRQTGARYCVEMHTSTMIPLFQVVIDTESKDNLQDAFNDAIKLCEIESHFQFKVESSRCTEIGLKGSRVLDWLFLLL